MLGWDVNQFQHSFLKISYGIRNLFLILLSSISLLLKYVQIQVKHKNEQGKVFTCDILDLRRETVLVLSRLFSTYIKHCKLINYHHVETKKQDIIHDHNYTKNFL